MNNNFTYQFGMYDPDTDSVIVKLYDHMTLTLNCRRYNSFVRFLEPDDIVYLYKLAEENPLTYAKLALKQNGLQDYVDAMEEFN
ncbi:MAG: hypothetical protein ACI4A3_07395 [Lachnospiraceae bacterium]